MSTLIFHVLQTSHIRARIISGAACCLWAITSALRLAKMAYSRHAALVCDISNSTDATVVTVRLARPIRLKPGNYFYIFFPLRWELLRWMRYNFLYSLTATAVWFSPPDDNGMVSTVTFILSRHGFHSFAVSQLQEGDSVFLDGPYGQEMGLQKDDIVVLAAKGLGIASTLPLVASLAMRLRHDDGIRSRLQELNDKLRDNPRDSSHLREVARLRSLPLFRDATKKVVLFWSLETNSQIDWLRDQLKSLQNMDPDNVSHPPQY